MSATDWSDVDVSEYRERFPVETRGLSDRQIFDVIAATDDDMEDADWKATFKAAQPRLIVKK